MRGGVHAGFDEEGIGDDAAFDVEEGGVDGGVFGVGEEGEVVGGEALEDSAWGEGYFLASLP